MAQIHIEGWRATYRELMPAQVLADLDLMTSAAAWGDRIQHGRAQILVAERSSQVLGFAMFGPSQDDDRNVETAELFALYVANDAQRRGLGRALCDAVAQRIVQHGGTACSVWVAEANAAAIAFYEKCAFQKDGATKVDTHLTGSPIAEVRLARRVL